MYNEQLETLIEMALMDGELTEKEKQILFKKAEESGVDLDEFEMVLEARLYEKKKGNTPVTAAPKSDKLGDVKKCPACGAIVTSFSTNCADCGYDFSNVDTSKNVEKFFEKLDEIELQRIDISTTEKDKNTKREKWKSIDSRKEEMILNFPVPVQKTEMIEFLTNAASRMHPSTYINTFSKDTNYRNKWNKIWVKKMDQVYSKAAFSMKDDKKVLEDMRRVTDEAHTIIKENNKKTMIGYLGIVSLIVILIGWNMISNAIENSKNKVITANIETLIQMGDYRQARNLLTTSNISDRFNRELNSKLDKSIEAQIEILINKEKLDEARELISSYKGDYRSDLSKLKDKVQLAELSKKLNDMEVLLKEKNYTQLQLELGKLTWTDNGSGWGLKPEFLQKKKAFFDQMPKNIPYSQDIQSYYGKNRDGSRIN